METINKTVINRCDATYIFIEKKGYKTVQDAIIKLGHKEFKRQRDDFYENYHPEIKEVNKHEHKSGFELRKEEKLKILTNRIEKCFDYIQNVPLVTRTAIKKELGITESQIFSMVRLGLIKNLGTNVKPKWVIATERRDYTNLANEVREYAINIQTKSN